MCSASLEAQSRVGANLKDVACQQAVSHLVGLGPTLFAREIGPVTIKRRVIQAFTEWIWMSHYHVAFSHTSRHEDSGRKKTCSEVHSGDLRIVWLETQDLRRSKFLFVPAGSTVGLIVEDETMVFLTTRDRPVSATGETR
jgi:hypothetical protein